MTRKLANDEQALWARVARTVKPFHAERGGSAAALDDRLVLPKVVLPQPAKRAPMRQSSQASQANTLDSTWDRRLGHGLMRPDFTIDLHDCTLASAYSLLDHRLEMALESGARLVLLITGKPPQSEHRPISRGAIRAAVGDWLDVSRHRGSIAAIRPAHPRHGGVGALYLVLRRSRVTA
jgi:DNA-nicking Smr family endonuclease